MVSLTFSLRGWALCHIECLRFLGAKLDLVLEVRAMADIVYLAIGVLFFILMGAYAIACNRL
jgi:hypothetical protein